MPLELALVLNVALLLPVPVLLLLVLEPVLAVLVLALLLLVLVPVLAVLVLALVPLAQQAMLKQGVQQSFSFSEEVRYELIIACGGGSRVGTSYVSAMRSK